jgi:hypothetical protein
MWALRGGSRRLAVGFGNNAQVGEDATVVLVGGIACQLP